MINYLTCADVFYTGLLVVTYIPLHMRTVIQLVICVGQYPTIKLGTRKPVSKRII